MEKVEVLVFPEMCITGYWHVRNFGRAQLTDRNLLFSGAAAEVGVFPVITTWARSRPTL